MRRVRLTGPSRQDIARALRHSEENFGKRARERYRRLFDQALRDLGEDPARIGVRAINDIREGYFTFHVRSSTKHASKRSVRQPRHLIAFYVDDLGDVIVARVFHERQMLSRHLTADNSE